MASARLPRARQLVAGMALIGCGVVLSAPSAPGSQSAGLKQLAGRRGCLAARHRDCAHARGLDGAESITFSSDGRSAYVLSSSINGGHVNALAVFRRDDASGVLTQLPGSAGCIAPRAEDRTCGAPPPASRFNQGLGPVAVSPDGRSVYVAGSTGLWGFTRDTGTGALTPLAPPAGCLSERGEGGCREQAGSPDAMAISQDGRYVYASLQTVVHTPTVAGESHRLVVLARDAVSGELTPLIGPGSCALPSGEDPQKSCVELPFLGWTSAVELSPDGRFLYIGDHDARAVLVLGRDPDSGLLQPLPTGQGCIKGVARPRRTSHGCTAMRGVDLIQDLQLSPDGRNVYLASSERVGLDVRSGIVVLARSARSGALHQLPGREGCLVSRRRRGCTLARHLDQVFHVAITSDGGSLYGAGQAITTFARRSDTGALRQRPGKAGCIQGRPRTSRCGRARHIAYFSDATLSPDDRTLYVASPNGRAVTVFATGR